MKLDYSSIKTLQNYLTEFAVLIKSISSNLFELIEQGHTDIEKLNSKTGIDFIEIQIMLDILIDMGYIKKDKYDPDAERTYINTESAKRFCLPSSKEYAGGFLLLAYSNFVQVVREPIKYSPTEACKYLSEMDNIDIAIDFTGKSVIDVGGGFSPVLFKLYDKYKITGTVIDIYDCVDYYKGKPVAFIHANFSDYTFNERYDVVLLFNILHVMDDTGWNFYLHKSNDILNESGYIVILDIFEDSHNAKVFDLIMYKTTSGRSLNREKIVNFLHRLNFTVSQNNRMIIAQKG